MKNWKKGLFVAFFSVHTLASSDGFLTDPLLQNPTPHSMNVVWFTQSLGVEHYVEYGEQFVQRAVCQTIKLSRMRESDPCGGCIERPIYRHEAVLQNLPASMRTPYRAVSIFSEGQASITPPFFCAPTPKKGSDLKILFTSDHQIKPMVAANLQKVKEVIPDIDAVFFAGDAVNFSDRASEWFDDPSGGSFFPCFQGKANRELGDMTYVGAPLLQYAPIFCAIGNHEVMGRWDMAASLHEQFSNPYPRESAKREFVQSLRHGIKDNSFNTDSYEEIFSLPTSPKGGKTYYAISFGDIRLVVLYATRMWRSPHAPESGLKGKYSESSDSLNSPLDWGCGDFIFEPIEKGSDQYQWLEEELQSEAFQTSKYKIVMLHNALHTLGENAMPPFAHPVQEIKKNTDGKIIEVRYHYPKNQDLLIRDVEPLLTKYGVQLVLCGHSHLWNRFQSKEGVHHLETSNVGNSYGAHFNPNGLSPIIPTLAPLLDAKGDPLPYIASNELTVFSIFSTATGAVDSYYFDTTKPNSQVIHFDRFFLHQNSNAELSSTILIEKHPLML